jgi:hypothetical protein
MIDKPVINGAMRWRLHEACHEVRLITDVPARLYGLKERGRITPGWHADPVMFGAGHRAGRDSVAAHLDAALSRRGHDGLNGIGERGRVQRIVRLRKGIDISGPEQVTRGNVGIHSPSTRRVFQPT